MVASCVYPYDDMILRPVFVREQCLPDVPKFLASLSRSSRNESSVSSGLGVLAAVNPYPKRFVGQTALVCCLPF